VNNEFIITPNQSIFFTANYLTFTLVGDKHLFIDIEYHCFADNRAFCEFVLSWESILSKGSNYFVILQLSNYDNIRSA